MIRTIVYLSAVFIGLNIKKKREYVKSFMGFVVGFGKDFEDFGRIWGIVMGIGDELSKKWILEI